MALASPGCTALNGSFIGGLASGSPSGTGFSAGDVITLTVIAAAGGDALGLADMTNFTSPLVATTAIGPRTYVVPANTAANFIIAGTMANAGSNFSWSCTPGSGSTGSNTDSEKLGNVQTQGSAVVGQTSGAAISGSVNGAIDNALNQPAPAPTSSAPTTVYEALLRGSISVDAALALLPPTAPSGYLSRDAFAVYWALIHKYTTLTRSFYNEAVRQFDTFTARNEAAIWTGTTVQLVHRTYTAAPFSAEPRSNVSDRAEEAFAALGYAAVNKAPSRMTPVFVPQWSTWADVRGSGFEQSDSGVFKGTQVNATAGLNYKIRPNLVVGLFGGYENFDYEFASVTGRLKGDGGTVGTYAGWQISPTLRWKGMVGWTGLGYDATAGTAAGSFDGSRWLFSTGLTGSYRVAAYIIEPSADVFAIWERQTAYTDTLGALHDARSFSSGRVALGGRALAPGQGLFGATPYLGVYGDWRFASNDALPAAVPFAGIGDGWSARVTGGLNMRVFTVGSLALGAEYGGIGADYKLWTGNARLTLPF